MRCKLNVITKMLGGYFSCTDGLAPLVNCIMHVSSPLQGLSGPQLNWHVIISEGKERPVCTALMVAGCVKDDKDTWMF